MTFITAFSLPLVGRAGVGVIFKIFARNTE